MEEIEHAPAPAEQSPVVETQETQQETPQNEAEPSQPRRSRREALEKAFSDVDKSADQDGKNADVKADAKASETDQKPVKKASETGQKPAEKPETEAKGPERGPDGKFIAKEQTEQKAPEAKGKLIDPPARFSEDAKKAWATAPEPVRAEAHRAIREMEQGIQKYQRAIEPIQPFLKMANGDPGKLASVMGRYVNTENLLRQNPAAGFTEIARNMGLSPQQVGKMLLGEEPGQPDPRDRQLAAMAQELQQLRQQTGQVTQTIQQQREQAVLSQVEQFAAQHPRFDELSEEIANMLKTGYARDLQDAYEKADRLNPAPAPVVQEEPPAQPAQTRQALSVTGAPTSGSNPAHRKPSANRKEALARSFARVGL